jgi:tetraacyldisaccharide 4'-kinase
LRVRIDEPSWWYGAAPDGAGGARLTAMAGCLAPLAAVYGWVARNRYARVTPYRSRLPVVCVGNLTAGGTGKTPLTLHLCERLQLRGLRPAVLTRGYGGSLAGPHWVAQGDSASAVGDEALLLARAAPTLVARDRAAGATAIEGAIEGEIEAAGASGAAAADVIVMDDGLQNPQLAKDLSLAVVDGSRGLGNGRVMPAGPLRAPLAFQLGLVDAIVINAPAWEAAAGVSDWLRQRFDGPLLRCTTVVAGDAAWLQGQRVVAWAGIGAPQRFYAMLRSLGADVVETVAFADHQRLTEADAQNLLAAAGRRRAALVSTAKDMARLKGASGVLADLAAATRVLPIGLQFAEPDAAHLAALIGGALQSRRG